MAVTATLDPWVGLVGQKDVRHRLEAASRNLVHAYLFLGNPGSGTLRAARGFAGLVLSGEILRADAQDVAGADRAIKLAIQGSHPDVVMVEAQGAALRVSEADQIAKASMRTPVEGTYKVIVVPNVDVIEATAIGKLLKVVEEPPPSTVFILLGQEVAPEFVTIASRCVTVEFGPLSSEEIASALRAETPGASAERLELASSAAAGDLHRARLLLNDEALLQRSQFWASLPSRLDGRGVTVAELVGELLGEIEASLATLHVKQQGEVDDLDSWVEQFGERGSGRSELASRHKRQARRLRTDEIRFGLAILARHYRDAAIAGRPVSLSAFSAIREMAEHLVHNPNETLQLQHLLVRLESAAPSN